MTKQNSIDYLVDELYKLELINTSTDNPLWEKIKEARKIHKQEINSLQSQRDELLSIVKRFIKHPLLKVYRIHHKF